MAKTKRRIKLIKPQLQLRLVIAFVALSALSLLMQAVLLAQQLTRLASYLPHDSGLLMNELPSTLGGILLVSFGLLLPMTITVGVLVTFKIAGPLYRFEVFLRSVCDGSESRECRIRKGDHLQELCSLINKVTEPMRETNALKSVPKSPEPTLRVETEAAARVG